MDQVRRFFVGLLVFALLAFPAYAWVVAQAVRMGAIGFETALTGPLGLHFLWAVYAMLGLAIIAVLLAFFADPPGGRAMALIGLVAFGALALKLPPWQKRHLSPVLLYDVSTDLKDRPSFTREAANGRTDKDNPLYEASLPDDPRFGALAAKPFAEVQPQFYPELGPIILTLDTPRVFDAALTVVQDEEWHIVTADKSSGVIEAVATTPWFGLVDDVVIRVRQEGHAGARVDMRAAARRGESDFGRNATRIKRFADALQAKLAMPTSAS